MTGPVDLDATLRLLSTPPPENVDGQIDAFPLLGADEPSSRGEESLFADVDVTGGSGA